MQYIDIPQRLTLNDMGLDNFGQSPLQFTGQGLNLKAQTLYDAGVPSNFIMDGDMIVRLNVVDGYLQSTNFVTGVSGWRIDYLGNSEFNSGVYRSSIAVGTDGFHVDISGNMWWGNSATYAGATYKISAAGGANLSGMIVSGGAASDVNNNATTISGGKITSNSITASQIQTNTLTVGTNVGLGTATTLGAAATYIVGNYITTGYINALGITAGNISANNISAGTITGSSVQASSNGNTIVLNSNNHLYFYNAENSAAVADLYATSNDFRIAATDNIYLYTNTTTLALNIGAVRTVPRSDNVHDIGTSANAFGAMYAHSFNDTSDKRLKKDIKTIKSALDKVIKLRGVSFKWKKGIKTKQIGLIAQEVKKIIPEVVGGKERYTIEYGKLAGLFVEAIKELNDKVDKLNK